MAGYEASANPDGGAIDSNPQAVHVDHRGAAVTDAGGNSLAPVGFDRRLQTLAVFGSRMAEAPPFLGLPPSAQSRWIRCRPVWWLVAAHTSWRPGPAGSALISRLGLRPDR